MPITPLNAATYCVTSISAEPMYKSQASRVGSQTWPWGKIYRKGSRMSTANSGTRADLCELPVATRPMASDFFKSTAIKPYIERCDGAGFAREAFGALRLGDF